MTHKRRRMFYTFKDAAHAGAYDELPMLPEGVDPQLHLSCNDRVQPFWLILEKDSVIVQMAGKARVEMRDSSVLWEDVIPGDYLYIPAGTPHRISPKEASIMYRFKADQAGLEAVSWYCEGCKVPLWRRVWDTARQSPQAGYLQACEDFNSHAEYRTCGSCTTVHPVIDLAGYRWADIDKELSSPQ
jgi:mannose-6-phosphate isomerase-like protein (cupin superfamily)